jgi:hypothetical protein
MTEGSSTDPSKGVLFTPGKKEGVLLFIGLS